MSDPRTVLHDRRLNEMCEKLGRHLAQERMARDDLWTDYWQRRRVVVVPDDVRNDVRESVQNNGQRAELPPVEVTAVILECIHRLKAAREKDAVNKNLSTLLAVVVKVQRDLEALLNGG